MYFTLVLSDAIIQLCRLNDLIAEEAHQLREVVNFHHLKHKQYADEIQTCIDNHSLDQSEIKRLSGSGSFVFFLYQIKLNIVLLFYLFILSFPFNMYMVKCFLNLLS